MATTKKKTRKTETGVESESTTKTSSAWVMNVRGRDAEVEKPKSNGGKFRFQPRPWRFRMKPDSTCKIIFLHNYDDSLLLREHKFDLVGSGAPIYGNILTCAEMVGESCPLCEVKKRHDLGVIQLSRLFSIIDLRPYKPKNGPEKKYQKLVLCQPDTMDRQFSKMAAKCADQRSNESDLRGAVFEVDRPAEQRSSAIGTMYDFIKIQKLSGSKNYADEDLIPYTDDEFGVNMELLEDAAQTLVEKLKYAQEDEDGDAEEVPY